MASSDGKPDIDTLKLLIDSAHELVADLAHGSTHRAIRALAAIPPDERSVIATALERAAVTWQQNEAFNNLHQVRVRANPNAQLFVRVFDDVPEPAPQDFDLLPEAVRLIRRLGVSMRPELRAVWEPAFIAAIELVAPEEQADCVRFLEHTLALIAAAPVVERAGTGDDTEPAAEMSGTGPRTGAPGRRR
jgi:hypothetical protein